MEPAPVSPPSYDTLAPGGCPKFPVSVSDEPASEHLPSYTPSVYKIAIVSRKIEWLTPYEASPSRLWKHIILELNLTQLNFYAVPTTLENHLLSFRPTTQSPERTFNPQEELEVSKFNSIHTSESDLQFLKYCQRLGLLNHPISTSELLESSDDLINSVINNNNPTPLTAKDHSKIIKLSRHKKLVRSFSLQHAKLGLAADYKKRCNVLRIRVESEQILLNFPTTRDLIEWNMALNTGKDLALDLNEREIPRYRTVPRRRRRNRFPFGALDMPVEDEASVRSKFRLLKLKSKLLSSRSSLSAVASTQFPFERNVVRPRAATVGASPSGVSVAPTRSTSIPTFTIEGYDEDDEDDDEEDEVSPTRSNTHIRVAEDDDEEDIQNLSDLHRSDDEDEDEDDDEEYELDPYNLDPSTSPVSESAAGTRRHLRDLSFSLASDYKWHPKPEKPYSQRRYYRNCLRCIKPLTSDEPWVSKSLVKPAMVSPLNLQYLRNVKYPQYEGSRLGSSSVANSQSSLHSLVSSNSSLSLLLGGTARKRNFSFKDVMLPDSTLVRVTNHYLKEYTVGSHGLIPKEINQIM